MIALLQQIESVLIASCIVPFLVFLFVFFSQKPWREEKEATYTQVRTHRRHTSQFLHTQEGCSVSLLRTYLPTPPCEARRDTSLVRLQPIIIDVYRYSSAIMLQYHCSYKHHHALTQTYASQCHLLSILQSTSRVPTVQLLIFFHPHSREVLTLSQITKHQQVMII
jgi:hypothetical protein